jgi:hypothetical protein
MGDENQKLSESALTTQSEKSNPTAFRPLAKSLVG